MISFNLHNKVSLCPPRYRLCEYSEAQMSTETPTPIPSQPTGPPIRTLLGTLLPCISTWHSDWWVREDWLYGVYLLALHNILCHHRTSPSLSPPVITQYGTMLSLVTKGRSAGNTVSLNALPTHPHFSLRLRRGTFHPQD